MGMTIGELRAAIADIPDELEILVAEDPEGNGFRPLQELAGGFIHKDDADQWLIEGLPDADDVLDGDEFDDVLYEERIILWP